LTELSADSDSQVREAVAGNVKTPANTLAGMEYDLVDIRRILATNSNTPLKTLKRLVDDLDQEVRNSAVLSILNKLF
jgi:hypothetical protein